MALWDPCSRTNDARLPPPRPSPICHPKPNALRLKACSASCIEGGQGIVWSAPMVVVRSRLFPAASWKQAPCQHTRRQIGTKEFRLNGLWCRLYLAGARSRQVDVPASVPPWSLDWHPNASFQTFLDGLALEPWGASVGLYKTAGAILVIIVLRATRLYNTASED